MKFSQILVFYLSLMVVPSALAVPLPHGDRCSSGSTDVRCIGHKDDHGSIPNSRLNGASAFRELPHQHIPLYLPPDYILSDRQLSMKDSSLKL